MIFTFYAYISDCIYFCLDPKVLDDVKIVQDIALLSSNQTYGLNYVEPKLLFLEQKANVNFTKFCIKTLFITMVVTIRSIKSFSFKCFPRQRLYARGMAE